MSTKKVGKLSVAVVALAFVGLVAFRGPGDQYFAIAKNLDIFATLYKEVNTYYVDEVNPNKLMKIGIDAMLKSLDPYTNYIPEDDIEDYRTMTTGQYGGIGAIIGKRNGKNLVLMPYRGFPAEKSGLKIGDELLEVDGVDVTDKNVSEISKLLKGQANTDLTVTIKRYGEEYTLPVTLKRERITVNNVPYSGMVTKDVGYIKLSNFTTGAGREVEKALTKLKEKGAKKIVFDLRGNPGGLLSESVNVSNVFVPKGSEIVSTKGKVKDWNKVYRAPHSPVDTEIPLAVLTSGRSASAAEIVSGVVQDYDRGVLVGEKTFGKGLVQATRPLTYNSQLKVTTAKYYTPSGRCIQAIDYSHRGEDGSVGRVPDSLRTAFETQNGRIVYDGGGVNPDIKAKAGRLAPITVSLFTKNLTFDYATKYFYEHKEAPNAKEFEMSDAEYNEFIAWLSDKDYDYVTEVEQTIDDLTEIAKDEQYYQDIKEQIAQLRKQVQHNKEQDLQKFKSEIKEVLEEEIAAHYHLSEGKIEASFDDDDVLQAAIDVLNDKDRYAEILRGQ
ncbi:S41 family peptidase [Tunicatimonas pelagia]|uniref:S41 family peptidase n=1 Tax=Tunicatimonas pelagia TaxID=931531 RepID=UPI0026667D07|nr:S41 family peptidase [Tunicatimonas pelagia]WKN45993.1 S41 family peptidase [Tunicatimonas pelagia]